MKKRAWIMIGCGLLFLLALGAWLPSQMCPPYLDQCLAEAPCWQEVCIGKTDLDQLIARWGNPVLVTETQQLPPWKIWFFSESAVQVWVDQEDVVQVILLDESISPKKYDLGELKTYVTQFGRPDKVSWAAAIGMQSWIWSRFGVAVVAIGERNWRDDHAFQTIYFSPQPLAAFLEAYPDWSFNGIQGPLWYNPGDPHNPEGRSVADVIASGPENPYDLSEIPVKTARCATREAVRLICRW